MEFGQCFEPQDTTRVCYCLLLARQKSVVGWRPLGSIGLVGDQFPIPAQNRSGFGRGSHFLESLSAQRMSDLSQSGPFSDGKEQPDLDLGLENAVFRVEIFIAQQQFLVNRSGDAG